MDARKPATAVPVWGEDHSSCSAKDWQSYSTRSCQPRELQETDARETIGPSRQRSSFAARNGKRPVPMAVQGVLLNAAYQDSVSSLESIFRGVPLGRGCVERLGWA